MGADYLKYEFTKSDGVRVTTILEGGKARIMKEGGEGSGSTLAMLERSQLTLAETALLQEISAIDGGVRR